MKDQEQTIESLLNELMEMSCQVVESQAAIAKYQMEVDTLRVNENYCKLLMRTIPHKIFAKDKNLAYVFCNENYAGDMKIQPEAIPGKTAYDFFPPKIAEEHEAAEKRILASGKLEDIAEWDTREGKEKLVRRMRIPLKDNEGTINGILGIEGEESAEYLEQRKELLRVPKAEPTGAKDPVQEGIQAPQVQGVQEKWEAAAQRLARENALWAEMGTLTLGKVNAEEIYESFSAEVGSLLPVDRLTITLPDVKENTLRLVYASGMEMAGHLVGDIFPFTNREEEGVIKSRSSLLLQKDHPEDILSRFQLFLPYFRAGFQSRLLVPLDLKDQGVGVLGFFSTQQNAYTQEDRELAERLGSLLAFALTQNRIHRDAQRLAETCRENEGRWQSLVESYPEAIFTLDLAGNILFVNPAGTRITGHSRDELRQKSFTSLVTREGRSEAEERFRQVIQGKTPSYDTALIRKDGQRPGIQLVYLPIIVDGKIVGAYAIVREVSPPAGSGSGPRNLLTEYESMVGYAPIGVWVYLEGKIAFTNSKCSEILGYSPGELTSNPFLKLLHSDDRQIVLERYSAWLSGKRPPDTFVSRFLHKEGHIRWLEGKVALISWEGRPALINYVRDITDHMNSKEIMRSSVEQMRTLINCVEDLIQACEDR